MDKSKKDVYGDVLTEIQGFYQAWLRASNLSEAEFLAYRTCRHFRVLLEELPDGLEVLLSHEKEQLPIGLPFFIGYDNNDSEKEQYFINTPLILLYLAGRLDKKNREEPESGSYGFGFFVNRVKNVIPQILEKKEDVFGCSLEKSIRN